MLPPGATLSHLQAFGNGLPRPLFFGVRPPGHVGPPPTTGYNLLSPQHLDDEGNLVLDGDVPEGALCASLRPRRDGGSRRRRGYAPDRSKSQPETAFLERMHAAADADRPSRPRIVHT